MTGGDSRRLWLQSDSHWIMNWSALDRFQFDFPWSTHDSCNTWLIDSSLSCDLECLCLWATQFHIPMIWKYGEAQKNIWEEMKNKWKGINHDMSWEIWGKLRGLGNGKVGLNTQKSLSKTHDVTYKPYQKITSQFISDVHIFFSLTNFLIQFFSSSTFCCFAILHHRNWFMCITFIQRHILKSSGTLFCSRVMLQNRELNKAQPRKKSTFA